MPWPRLKGQDAKIMPSADHHLHLSLSLAVLIMTISSSTTNLKHLSPAPTVSLLWPHAMPPAPFTNPHARGFSTPGKSSLTAMTIDAYILCLVTNQTARVRSALSLQLLMGDIR